MRRYIRGLMAAALLGSTTACLDLNVTNENLPDIDRALGEPADVEQVIASSFFIWHTVLHGLADVSMVYPTLADEATNTATNRNVFWGQEPRQPLVNDPLASQVWVPRRPWDYFAECVANANDGLREIDQGMVIRTLNPAGDSTVDNTDRAYSIGKFWQGTCLGYLALSMDKYATATEDSILPQGYEALLAWERQNIKPYDEGLPVAIRSLEQAIERMENSATNWVTDQKFVPNRSFTRDEWKMLAHTMIARIMIYSARSPEERQALDWNKILYHTERGMAEPFVWWGPVLQSGVITDGSYIARLQPGTGTTAAASVLRADPYLLGPADQSGNYRNWLAKPIEARDTFLITTPDRRITGTTPASSGAYMRYRTNNNGVSNTALGTNHFSSYDWHRRSNYQTGANSANGDQILASADENRLFRAEALLRLNRPDEAIALINVTRTRLVKVGTNNAVANLPPIPVGATEVPTVNGQCVPRKVLRWVDRTPANADRCGDLWDALMWERQIELYGQNPMRAWHDFRGFGQLQPGTLLHMPVPARYLTSLEMPFYTFGGIGQPGSAPGTLPGV